jgi:hypothetical protein
MRKIAINLETQKRNASRSLPVRYVGKTHHTNDKRQAKENFIRYKAIKSKWASCFIPRMLLNLLFLCHMKENIYDTQKSNENYTKKSVLLFAVPANVSMSSTFEFTIIVNS